MASFKLRRACLTLVLFSIGISSCRGQGGGGGGAVAPGTQDAIQIVAQAALCFDNRTVINGCLQALGINTSAAAAPAAPANVSAATLCSAPCFGQVKLVLGCVNDILGNIRGYRPALMQGVEAIFQMACGQGGGSGGNSTSGSGGGGAGSATNSTTNSSSHVGAHSPGQRTSGAAGPTGSLTSVFSTLLIVWAAGTALMLF